MKSIDNILFQVCFWSPRIILFIYGFLKQKNDPELFLLNGIGPSVFVSRGAGLVLSFDCGFLLLLTCRNFWTWIRSCLGAICISRPSLNGKQGWLVSMLKKISVSLDNHTYAHRWTAYSMLLFTFLHTNAHYVNFYFVEKRLPILGFSAAGVHYYTFAGITGHIMLLVMFFMYTSSHKSVRKNSFETFYYLHHLFLLFYFALFFHSAGCFVKSAFTGECKGYRSNWFTIPVFVLYMIERGIRFYRSRLPTKCTRFVLHPSKTLEIQFEKPAMSYLPGQYVFVCAPALSTTQWHPFTLSSAPEEGFKSIHIRCNGDWTNKLLQVIQKDYAHDPTRFELRVDGPFGAPAQDVYAYPIACLVSTGIGVTPSAAILKSMLYRYQRGSPMVLRKLYFIWLNRDAEAFKWFQSLIDAIHQTMGEDRFKVYTFFTGKLSSDEIQSIVDHEDKSEWMQKTLTRGNKMTSSETYAPGMLHSVSLSRTPSTLLQHSSSAKGLLSPAASLSRTPSSTPLVNTLRTAPGESMSRSPSSLSTISGTSVRSQASTLAFDPITGLRSHTFYGRPQWKHLFKTITRDIEAGIFPYRQEKGSITHLHTRSRRRRQNTEQTRVGIFYCGPNPLLRQLALEILQLRREDTSSPIVFDLNYEHF